MRKLILSGVTEFLNGGMGAFDWMRAHQVYEIKKLYPEIRNYLIIPYLTFSIREKKFFDEIIYPDGFEKPVLDALLAWANVRNAAPKSALGKALTYLKDGRLELNNNRAERSIKPFVIDRKNFLFANTPGGVKGSAVMFSLIQTSIENGGGSFPIPHMASENCQHSRSDRNRQSEPDLKGTHQYETILSYSSG